MRLAPPASGEAEPQAQRETSEGSDGSAGTKRRGGLGGWLRRNEAAKEESSDEPGSTANASPTRAAQQSDSVDADHIDWDSLSKAERRRLRKQLKRQNRAA